MPLDSIAVLSPLDRATDANGNPVPGAKLRFYEAGTSTPKTVYSDSALTQSLGSTVTCDAGGYPTSDGSTQVSIYVGSDAYKLVVTTSADVTVHTRDNLKGAPEIPDVASTALPNTPVVSKTSTYTILSTDQGKLIQADPTGGSFALTLPSAITVGDNFRVGVRHNGASTSNVVGVRATGGQTVGAPGQASATSIALTGYGQTIWLVSNGADWVIDGTAEPLMMGGLPFFKITDRLTAPPVSPTGGNRYIVNGTPTGVWLTLGFAEDDIAEADGNGSWLKYSPAAGFFAYVADEDLFSKFDGTSWEDQTGMGAADSSTLKTAVYEHQVAQNSGGGTNTNGSWATRPLTTEVVDSIGMSVSSNEITVPVGTYLVVAQQQLFHQAGTLGSTGIAQQRLTAVTATFDALPLGMPTRNGGVASGSGITFDSYHTHALHDIYLLNVTVAGTIKLEYKTNFQTSTNGLGYPANNGTEVYARVAFLSLTSLQGATGAQGIQGNDGLDAAIPMQWSTATSGDPGSGKVRGNNATIASITEIAVSETDAAGGSLGNVLTGWAVSTSSAKGTIKLTKEGAPQNFHLFRITAAGTDLGSYRTFAVTYVSTSGTISNGNDLAMLFVEKGDIGDPGTTVPDVSGLTEDTANNDETDFLLEYDVSASNHKKVKTKNLGFTPAAGSLRGLQSKLRDIVSVKDHLAVGNGSADDTAFITAADAAAGAKYVPAGIYDTTLAATDLDGPYWGHGQIRDVSDNERAPWFTAIKAAPSSFGNHDSVDTAFGGDISKIQLAFEHRITGVATLGQPSSGYLYTPEAYPFYGWLYNESGHNQSTSTNTGRTAAAMFRARVYQAGQGDAVAYNASVYVTGTRSGSTSFLANPAGVIINGDMQGGTDGVYLNPGEWHLSDLGNDIAAIGWVVNLDRSDATGAKNAWWAGFRAQSTGSADADSAFSVAGAFKFAFDASQGTYPNNAAFVMKADHRFYGNATADASGLNRYPNSLGTSYFTFSSSLGAWHFVTDNASALQIYQTQVLVPSIPLNINGSVLQVSGTQVVGARDTGWTAMTGTPNESTSYDTSTVTLPQLAGRVAALQAALTTHGLLGA